MKKEQRTSRGIGIGGRGIMGRTWATTGAAMLVLAVLGASGCNKETKTTEVGDTVPPAQVTDLRIALVTDSVVALGWTAVADIGTTGTRAKRYDIRYADRRTAAWDAMLPVPGQADSLLPAQPGSDEVYEMLRRDLDAQSVFFAMKVGDAAGNWSERSNTAQFLVPDTTDLARVSVDSLGPVAIGSPEDEPGRLPDEHLHADTLSHSFYVSKHEVTQEEWLAVMGWNESYFVGMDRPVENVTWFDAIEYCIRLSELAGLGSVYAIFPSARDGNHIVAAQVGYDFSRAGFRLLTEAEWEYACRAGATTAFSGGAMTQAGCAPVDPVLDGLGWYCGNSQTYSFGVMQKAPNAWGLHDMHGNVGEWCWDWYDIYGGNERDPVGAAYGVRRIVRGGDFGGRAAECRAAARGKYLPGARDYFIGLRVCRRVM